VRIVLLLSVLIVTFAAIACGGGSKSDVRAQPPTVQVYTPPTEPPRTSTPTPYMGWKYAGESVVDNTQDAVDFARDIIESCPGVCGTPNSVEYVETTVGEAREVLDPGDGYAWEYDNGARAVVVVVTGDFHSSCVACSPQYRYFGTVWIVAPIGQKRLVHGDGDTRFDLARLGTVHAVPLPLAEFPTPVALDN
jgi:hypothetical protein